MQTDPRFFVGNASHAHAYEVGGYAHLGDGGAYGTHGTTLFCPAGAGKKHDFSAPATSELEFQQLEACPKNFIIFDQTDNRSRVMFHPMLADKFSYPNPLLAHGYGKSDKCNDSQGKVSSSLKEDTEEINALLSSEEEEEEAYEEEAEDDVVSTGRTPGNWKRSYRYSSSSTEGSKSQMTKSSFSAQSSFSSSASSSGRKRERMKKMVKTLRGIIPGGDDLDTPAILDEAVKYLKSLKMEAKKLGIENLEE